MNMQAAVRSARITRPSLSGTDPGACRPATRHDHAQRRSGPYPIL